MVRILYPLSLFFLALFAFPKMLYMLIFRNKYRKSLLKRFGKGFPIIKKGERPLFWIHAVSVGETKAAAKLCKLLKNSPKNPILVISSTTETGHEEAVRSMPFADYHVYLPFDFKWLVRPIVKQTAPDLIILCESDFWLNFLQSSKEAGAKVALVNGKISENSFKRFKAVSAFKEALFSSIDLFCIQNDDYKKRFEQLGIPPEKLYITGNIKFDDLPPEHSAKQINDFKDLLGIVKGDLVLVAGSTHHPEEKMVLELLPQLWTQFPNLKLIFAPRHPERFNEVEALIKRGSMEAVRFTQINHSGPKAKIVLIDCMGLLRQCYQLADIAIVGGSFTAKVGGHNILEPGCYGVPVIYGPHMYSQTELMDLSKQYGTGIQAEKDSLMEILIELLRNPEKRSLLGASGKRLLEDAQGATEKTLTCLNKKNAI